MAWTAPMTAVANSTWTAAQWNAHVRDNLLQTMPGLASGAGDWFTVTGTNVLAQRDIATAATTGSSTTASTSYTNLADAVSTSVTMNTGTSALVMFGAQTSNSASNNAIWVSYAVSSATTISAADTWAFMQDGITTPDSPRGCGIHLVTNLTAGSNVFTLKYKTSSGTATYANREITVIGL